LVRAEITSRWLVTQVKVLDRHGHPQWYYPNNQTQTPHECACIECCEYHNLTSTTVNQRSPPPLDQNSTDVDLGTNYDVYPPPIVQPTVSQSPQSSHYSQLPTNQIPPPQRAFFILGGSETAGSMRYTGILAVFLAYW